MGPNIEQRFWSKVDRNGPVMPGMTSRCWIWTACVDDGGYGRLNVGEKKERHANRVGYELQVAPIPEGMDVCHHCDNPPCVRGDHLFVGTEKDNVADMIRKGRRAATPRGEMNPNARLSDAQRETIRVIRRSGFGTRAEIGAMFGVTGTTVYRICGADK